MSSLQNSSWLYLILSTLTGLVGAFVNPLMSFFLVEGLGAEPIYIGLYTVLVTIAGLFISQLLGAKADNGVSARKLYIASVIAMGTGLVLYANLGSYWMVLLVGICMVSIGNAAIPQMLTVSRQWADRNKKINTVDFNARLRAAISLAWIIGPAVGFALAGSLGFSSSFYIAAIFSGVAALFAFKLIPEVKVVKEAVNGKHNGASSLSFWMLGLSVTFASVANILYSSAMPLYTIKELGFASYSPGLLMGLVALLEIPVMLYAGKLSQKITKHALVGVAYLFAIVFYSGIFFSTDLWHFICLQFVNAIFYGLFAGLSLTLLQDELPLRVGYTSAFYSNAIKIGMMLGTSLTGVIAQFTSFRHANLGALIAVCLALICLLYYRALKKKV
ncbi:sugar efflux transporter [Catenovulum maritimum]|uniref:Major facilitator superfamily (MFS) profile domain-containing protein n=1 Tax=Catenovulum maritimum TaxID=1513271 RepID=A0A0J8GTY9_9ALTE|nr:sugar efflux transporter [Catenovulum maritimum]KMT66207.1 hypothetical protein XM47_04185 [Catenovulum maritimum]